MLFQINGLLWREPVAEARRKRALLVSPGRATQQLNRAMPDNPGIVMLQDVYHDVLRMRAET